MEFDPTKLKIKVEVESACGFHSNTNDKMITIELSYDHEVISTSYADILISPDQV